jgi:hypothetical protein
MNIMKNELSEPVYKSKDLGLSTFLFTADHKLVCTTVEDPRKVIFHFRRKQDTDSLILSYFNGTAQAPAKKLFENYRTLRGLVYTRTNNVK